MGVGIAYINISNLNDEFRFSVQHSIYKSLLESTLGNIQTKPFKFFLKSPPQYGSNSAAQDFENEDDYRYIRITDIDSFGNLLMDEKTTDISDYDKYLLKDNDLLLARSGNTVGKSFLYKENLHPKAVFAGYFIKFELNEDFVIPDFVFLYTKTKMFELWKKSTVRVMGQPNINAEEYKSLPIPTLDINIQKIIVAESSVIQTKIQQLSFKIKDPLEIINEIFAKEFKYSPNLWKEFGKGMTAGTQESNPKTLNHFLVHSSQISLNSILRFSSRFHNPATIQLNEILEANKLWRIEDVVTEIKKGIQPSYDTDGDVKVVKIANMKNGYIDFTEAELVSEEFYDSVKGKAGIDQGDILVCCTGKVSLGKVDYYNRDEPAILSVDSYIIRLNEKKIHPLFFTYFFRGILGAYQIERDYTGTTNQIHLYDSQIRDFRLPKIHMKRQQKIVDQVKKALDEQRKIENQIEERQNEISKIVEDAIKKTEG